MLERCLKMSQRNQTRLAERAITMLTVADLSAWLNVKPSTLYLWAAQGKIPCRRLNGLLRFERPAIQAWLEERPSNIASPRLPSRPSKHTVDELIEAAKRAVYTPCHGETGPKSGLIRREDE